MRKKKFLLSIFLCMGLSIGGVYATWRFADKSPRAEESIVAITMGEFSFKPEEVLPGGGETNPVVTPGENHYKLLDLVLNEDDKGYGLNINDNVLLHQYLRRKGIIYSNQKVSGGNLKFILDAKNNTHGLYYCLEKVSDTEYYCYTFSVEDLRKYAGTTMEILAYRTILVKTDIWRATITYIGTAPIKSLSALGESADSNTIGFSIDVRFWHIKTTE